MKLNTTYQENRRESIAVNGNHFPNKSLCELDAIPKFAVSVNRWMPYIRSVNEAHVVMLYEQGILKLREAGAILKAIEELDYEGYKSQTYCDEFEDMYFQQEKEIIEKSNGAGGNMHLGRSRNDMCITWTHLNVREGILDVMETLIQFQNTVRLFCEEHKDTLYVIHTHTQHAQPGIMGHYFLGFLDVLDRCIRRFKNAYDMTNVSPMGAAVATTSAYPISRERVAELLGCDGIIENAYDSIGNIEYYSLTASAVTLCAIDLSKTITDMILWATEEEKMIIFGDGLSSISSIMPQKRNPIVMEHLRACVGVAKGLGDTVQTACFRTPYGDICDYEDMDSSLFSAFSMLKRCLKVFDSVMATIDVNKPLLRQRAFESFSVVTEMADEMYRSYGIPFRKAHGFVSYLVKKARAEGYDLRVVEEKYFADTYEEYFHEPFTFDFAPIAQSIDPDHFVKVREVVGGTGPKAMAAQLVSAQRKVKENAAWYDEKTSALAASDRARLDAVNRIIKAWQQEK